MPGLRPSAAAARGRSRAARGAVATLFFVNGAAFANWVPRIPEVKADLGLDAVALGTALLGVGLGGLVGSFAAGPLIARFSSRSTTLGAGLALCAALPLPAVAPTWLALLAALTFVGAADAVTDVAMNAHGVLVQRRYRRPILNTFHAMWSLGSVTGALTGSAAAAAGFATGPHLATTGLLLAALTAAAGRWFLSSRVDRTAVRGPVLHRPTPALVTLALLAFCVGVAEGAPGDWSAVYLAENLGMPAGAAGGAFAAFSAAMLAGRLVGDRAVGRWGVVKTARAGAVLAGTGLAAGLAIGRPVAAIAAFGLVGLGVCTVFPAMFGAAGRLPDLPPGAGISMTSLAARLGFLSEPAIIGSIAGATSLPTALTLVVLAAAVIAVFAKGLSPAESAPASIR